MQARLDEHGPAADEARTILSDSHVDAGYALTLGASSEALARELVARSRLHVVILEPDPAKADRLRRDFSRDGLYGSHLSVLAGDLTTAPPPPYFASLVIAPAGDGGADSPAATPVGAAAVMRALDPYHGCAYVAAGPAGRKTLAQWSTGLDRRHAAVADVDKWVRLNRFDGLPGAGNWTNEHADEGNTRVSRDSIVKAPLGVLWFGGSSHFGILPRHGHGPQPQVIDGRCVVEGVDIIRAVDIYTGRVLWETLLPGVGSYYNITTHQFGANGTGSNYVSRPDGIYVAMGRTCVRLDPATGRQVQSFDLPKHHAVGPDEVWSYINVSGDYLVAGVEAKKKEKPAKESTGPKTARPSDDDEGVTGGKQQPITNPRTVGSKVLMVMDRRTGKLLWSALAKNEFRHNAICIGGGRLYAIDRVEAAGPSFLQRDANRKAAGEEASDEIPAGGKSTTKPDSKAARLLAFDLATGQVAWTCTDNVFGTWLSYSPDYDALVECGRMVRDTLKDEGHGMRAFQARDRQGPVERPQGLRPGHDPRQRRAEGKQRGRPDDRRAAAAQGPAHRRRDRVDLDPHVRLQHARRQPEPAHLPLGGGRVLRPRPLRRHRQLRRVPLQLHQQPHRRRRRAVRPRLHPHLHLQLPDPDQHRAGPRRRSRDVDLPRCRPRHQRPYPPARPEPRRRRRPDGRRRHPLARVPQHRRQLPRGQSHHRPRKSRVLPPARLGHRRPHAVGHGLGVRGLQSLKISLNGDHELPRTYTVRLYFGLPHPPEGGPCVMDVSLQGVTVDRGLDVLAKAGGYDRSLVREYKGVRATEDITVDLKPAADGSTTTLCGVELIADEGQH